MHHLKPSTIQSTVILSVALTFLIAVDAGSVSSSETDPSLEELKTGTPFIYRPKPDERGGQAYKLVYLVGVPIDIFWKFKTDFQGDFLLSHEFIEEHRFLNQTNGVVITENRYSNSPNVTFRWRTTLHPASYRIDFVLENPKECAQEFHYGHIQLEALGTNTKVTQVAYFSFWGATFWAYYPWHGGMSEFLHYTARWEQETVLRLRERYSGRVNR